VSEATITISRTLRYGTRYSSDIPCADSHRTRLASCGYRASCLGRALKLSTASFRLRLADKRPIRVVVTAAGLASIAGWKFVGFFHLSFDTATIRTVNSRDEVDSAGMWHGGSPFWVHYSPKEFQICFI
jgi:hypothetical protein